MTDCADGSSRKFIAAVWPLDKITHPKKHRGNARNQKIAAAVWPLDKSVCPNRNSKLNNTQQQTQQQCC